MIKSVVNNNFIKLAGFVLALSLSIWVINKSIFLRWFGYENYPKAAADEFTYVWQGISLKRYGLPMAWTINNGVYLDQKRRPLSGRVNGFGIDLDDGVITVDKFKKSQNPMSAVKEIDYQKGLEQMFFVAPFFDHPPLGGLIYSLGEDNNIKNVEDVKMAEVRRVSLIMAIITAGLLFIFITLISSNPWIGMLGTVVYSIAPTYLLATRTAFLENVVSPFILTHLILLFLYIKYNSKKYSIFLIILSGLFGGLGVLAKEPAIGFLIGSTIILWINKIKIKNILFFIGSCFLPILIYMFWGLWLQRSLFIDILLTNSSRGYFGAIKPLTMLEALKFANFPTDGWWVWGWLSFILLSLNFKNKNTLILILPLFTHFLVVLLLGSMNAPWYWISMIPFLAGCGGLMIWEIINKPTIVNALLFFFIPFSSSYYWGREALMIAPSISHYRLSLAVFSLFLFLRIKYFKNIFFKFVWTIFMAWLIYKIIIFNELFMPYLIAHWGNLSLPNFPTY